MNVLPYTSLPAGQHYDRSLVPAVQHNGRTLEKNGFQLIRINLQSNHPRKKSLLCFMMSTARNCLTSLEVSPVIMGTTPLMDHKH